MSESRGTTTPPIEMTGYKGTFDGTWVQEEDAAGARHAIRVRERLHHEQSDFQDIAVYDSAFFGRVLTLDGLVMFTERDEFVYHEMLAHVPLCSMPDPKSVLVIGGGDTGIIREVVRHPSVERVVQCEIDERVTRVCEMFFDWVKPTIEDPRVELVFDDGVAYMEQNTDAFDLIIVDSTDPIGPAVGLFQRDFYRKVAASLRKGGVMVAQTESPHWAAKLVGPIYKEIRVAFKHVSAYMGFIPTYPSGSWCWAYASNDRKRDDFVDAKRLAEISRGCRYYNAGVHDGAFRLPTFAARAVAGENVFARFEGR